MLDSRQHKELLRSVRRAARKAAGARDQTRPETAAAETDLDWRNLMSRAAALRLTSSKRPPNQAKSNGKPPGDRYEQLLAETSVSRLLQESWALSSLFEVLHNDRRAQAANDIQEADKVTPNKMLAAFSQVFTPPHIVQLILKHCLIEPYLSEPSLTLEKLSALRILDPCVGAGIFLTEALHLLVPAYKRFNLSQREAVNRALQNLHGLDIDQDSLWTAALALTTEARILVAAGETAQEVDREFDRKIVKEIDLETEEAIAGEIAANLNLQLIEDCLGSLNPDLKVYNRPFQVIVTNPPYLGRKLISRPLKDKLKKYYPQTSHDLSQAFLWQALDLIEAGGKIGFLTQSSFLSLSSALPLRKKILSCGAINYISHLGPGVFPLLSGEKADSAVIIITGSSTEAKERKVIEKNGESGLMIFESNGRRFEKKQCDVAVESFMLSRPAVLNDLSSRLGTLGDLAEFKQGLATTDNERFIRYVWELPAEDLDWVPYAKGGGARRWWKTIETRVFWKDQGRAIKETVALNYPYLNGKTNWVVKNEDSYFKEGLTFSFVSRKRLSVRRLPAGAIFDVGGSAIFAHNKGDELFLMAYLNSALASALACDLNPTINFQVGDLKRIPQNVTAKVKEKLASLSAECVELVRELEKENLSTATAQIYCAGQNDWSGKPVLISAADWQSRYMLFEERRTRLEALEASIDEIVLNDFAEANSLGRAERTELNDWASQLESKPLLPQIDRSSYALGKLIQLILRHCLIEKAPVSINAAIDSLFSEAEKTFLETCLDENLERFISTRLNKVLLEEFSSQPPLIVAQSKLASTVGLLKDRAYAEKLGRPVDSRAMRPKDLFNQ